MTRGAEGNICIYDAGELEEDGENYRMKSVIDIIFFHGVTARGGPKPPSFWDFIPKVFLVGKCAFCSE